MRLSALFISGLLLLPAANASASGRARDPWNIWGAGATTARTATPLFDASMQPVELTSPQAAAPAKVATEYSDGYRLRARIHKVASLAMLPLVGTEVVLGQSLYTNGGDSKKSAHVIVGTGIGTLFGINTVTGAWNLWEARKDPNGRKRRLAHGLLMMAADVGFLITPMVAPDSEDGGGSFSNDRSTHRAVAFTSMGVATVGYLVMLLGR